jgi:hypothetical protein
MVEEQPNDPALPDQPTVVLQRLTERHKQVAALLAQGVPRQTIAEIVQYTPEYITFLQRQPLFIQYVKEVSQAASIRLEALFDRAVDAIADGLSSGGEVALKAARLQMEATGRIGAGKERQAQTEEGMEERLGVLADRLVRLLQEKRGQIVPGQVVGKVVEDAST